MRHVIVLIMLLGFLSCQEAPPAPLSSSERKVVDSLYTHQSADIRNEVDSICNIRRQSMFQQMVDSIKTEYVKDIESIISE